MAETVPAQTKRRLMLAGGGLTAILSVGTLGYWFISGGTASLVDCFYMTFITITTIGFGEVIDLAGNPGGRLFTVLISLSGVGTMTYLLMTITSFVVEGQINAAFRRGKMEKKIEKFKDHYVVCGVEGTALYVLNELRATKRSFVVADPDQASIDRLLANDAEIAYIVGDPTDNATLMKAGLERARGLFAVTDDDNQNLVITLTAKQINPRARVVVSCLELRNSEKMRRAGADAVVSPSYIGGLRMASEMIRPAVVSFLDIMMSRKEEPLRVEEVVVGEALAGRKISDLDLGQFKHLLLLALRTGGGWQYNPPRSYVMKPGDTLVVMATPEERQQLERVVGVKR